MEQKGPWRIVSEHVVQYLIATRQISEWLSDFSIPDKDGEEADFSALEKMISDREGIMNLLKDVDRVDLEKEVLNEDEAMCRKLSTELLSDIAEIEESNEALMQKHASGYRQKLKNIKQARETMTAYNQTQAYSAPVDALGHNFNQAN